MTEPVPASRWLARSGHRREEPKRLAHRRPSTGLSRRNSPGNAGNTPGGPAMKRGPEQRGRTPGNADGKRLETLPCHPPCSMPRRLDSQLKSPRSPSARANSHSNGKQRSQMRSVMVPSQRREKFSLRRRVSYRVGTDLPNKISRTAFFSRVLCTSFKTDHGWSLSALGERRYHAEVMPQPENHRCHASC